MMKRLVCLVLLFIPSLIFPQTEKAKKDSVLNEVILFSSPHRALMQTPVTFSEMKRSDFEKLNYGEEVSQYMQQLPGVTSYTDNGMGFGYSYLRFRGIDQNRLNITINGLPLNEPEDEGVYFSNFPDLLTGVGNIQLQRGLGLSKSGVAGFGGNIDFNTFQKPDTSFVAGLDAGSYNSERLFIQQQTGNSKNNFFYKLSGLHSNGYKYHSGNNSGSGMFQWQHKKKNDEWKYLLLLGINKNGLAWLGVSDSLIKIDPVTNGNSPDEKGNFLQVLQQLHYRKILGAGQSFNASVFYNYTKGDYGFDLMNFLGYPSAGSFLDYKTHSSFAGIQSSYNYASHTFSFSTGVYASLYKKTHTGIQYPADTMTYDNYGIKNEASVFSKFMYHRNNWFLFGDLQYRYSAFSYHGDVPLKNFYWPFLNPLAGITYRIHPGSYLYYSIGKTRREPGRNDIFLGNDNLGKDSSGNAVYANLQPENNFSQEIGWRYENKKLQFSVNAYWMQLKNEITLNGQIGPTGLPLRSNVAKSIRQGIETEWRYRLNKKWSFYQSFAYAPHKVIQDKISFSPVLTPEYLLNNEINFSLKKWQLILQNRYQGSSYIDFANKNKLPEYVSFNLIGIYEYKHFTFSARLLNLTDKIIYTDGQLNVYGTPIYHVQAPLHFMLGMTIHY